MFSDCLLLVRKLKAGKLECEGVMFYSSLMVADVADSEERGFVSAVELIDVNSADGAIIFFSSAATKKQWVERESDVARQAIEDADPDVQRQKAEQEQLEAQHKEEERLELLRQEDEAAEQRLALVAEQEGPEAYQREYERLQAMRKERAEQEEARAEEERQSKVKAALEAWGMGTDQDEGPSDLVSSLISPPMTRKPLLRSLTVDSPSLRRKALGKRKSETGKQAEDTLRDSRSWRDASSEREPESDGGTQGDCILEEASSLQASSAPNETVYTKVPRSGLQVSCIFV
jgi:hypothetical protein